MKNSRKTTLDVSPSGTRHVIVRFNSRGGGSRNWQFIVDGFAELLARVREKRGTPWTLPEGGRSLGRGRRLKIDRRVYRAVRAEFVVMDEVAEALNDQTLVIDDAWLFNEIDRNEESSQEAS